MGDIDKLGKMCHHFAFLVNFSWNFVRLWAQSAENFTICPKFGIENWKICKICKKKFGALRRHVGEWKIFMGGPPTQWSFKWWRFWLPWRDFEIFGWGDPRGPPPAASLPLEKTLKGAMKTDQWFLISLLFQSNIRNHYTFFMSNSWLDLRLKFAEN